MNHWNLICEIQHFHTEYGGNIFLQNVVDFYQTTQNFNPKDHTLHEDKNNVYLSTLQTWRWYRDFRFYISNLTLLGFVPVKTVHINTYLFIVYLTMLSVPQTIQYSPQKWILKSTIINLQSFVASPNTLKFNYRKQVSYDFPRPTH
jgi:hypothetical protein